MPLWLSLAGTLCLLLSNLGVQAAPFRNLIVPFKQPDGTLVQVVGTGDEFYAKFETKDGFTAIFDPALKAYCFARQATTGNLESTGVQIHKSTGAALGLAKHLKMSNEARKNQVVQRYQAWEQQMQIQNNWKAHLAAMHASESSGSEYAPPGFTTLGNKVGLCLLIDFDDDPATIPQADIIDFCNGDNYTSYGNNGSVKQYYKYVSNSKLIYTNAVTAYVRIPNSVHPKSYYNDTTKDAGSNARGMIADALTILQATSDYTTAVLPLINAATVDSNNLVVACNVFYAGDNGGVWAAGLWPHSGALESATSLSGTSSKLFRYQVSNIGSDLSIGTFCHENGHMLCGYPDLYDYGYDSVGGAGDYCLMAAGEFDKTPVQICAYLKRASGWATTTDLDVSSGVQGTLTASPGTNFNHFYRYQKPGVPTEYFLVENRYASGYDSALPGSGVLIWHVDELGDRDNQSLAYNTTHSNYELTLVQADNMWDFEYNVNSGDAYDPYYKSNPVSTYDNEFSDNSLPGAQWWDGTDSGFYVHDFSDKSLSMSLILGYPSYVAISYLTNTLTGGNGNGLIDFDECNNMTITITNRGTVAASSVQGILSTSTDGVFIAQPYSDFATIEGGGYAMNRTAFRISTSPNFVCGTPIKFQLILKADQGVMTNYFTVKTGTLGKALKFSNDSAIAIPDYTGSGTGVYSPVTVSGIDGVISKVLVSTFIQHPAVGDLTLELIAPDGTKVLLSQNNGGVGENYGVSCDGVRTTFDDDAPASILSGTAPFAGSFQPQQMLSAVANRSGTNVNGIWKLHVVDSFSQDVGTLECWTLQLAPTVCSDGGGECAGVDLSVTMSQQPVPASVGIPLVYNLVVSNAGPSTAKGVIVTQTLPLTETNGVIYSTSVLSQGSASALGDIMNCNLGNLLPGTSATIAITVIPQAINSFITTATVGSTATDYNSVNNSVTQTTTVMGGRSDLAVTISASPTSVLAGGTLTYTVNVLNYGPSAATNVVVTNTLASSLTNIVVQSSQGASLISGSSVFTALGNLDTNGTATITIRGTPLSAGRITAVAMASSDMLDPVTGNNVAVVTTDVGKAADISVTLTAQPNPVLIGSNLTYTLHIANRGPSDATTVSLTHVLPNNILLVGSTTTQGSLNTNAAGLITGDLGALATGASAEVKVVIVSSKAATLVSSASVTSDRSDSDLSNNSVTNISFASPPIVTLGAGGALLVGESVQPNDGVIEPGETVAIQFGLANSGTITATNVVAQLQLGGGVLTPQISLPTGVAPLVLQSYGNIAPGSNVSRPFTFTAVTTNIGTIKATLLVQYGTNSAISIPFSFSMPNVATFSNTNSIVIPDRGLASVYPSVINVSGVVGSVKKVTATLSNFAHTYPHDVSVLLVNPSGRSSILMSHASLDNGLTNGEQITLTFDGDAVQAIPASSRLSTGSYQPAQYAPAVTFSNAPAGPYISDLSIFGGVDPNGDWQLYVLDDSNGDSGQIFGGWSLSIVTVTPINPVADLAMTGGASVGQALIGDSVTYNYLITNNGPSTASVVLFTNTFPAGVAFVSSSAAGTNYGQQFVANLGSLPVGSTALLSVVGKITAQGSLTTEATVASSEIDLGKANNTVDLVVIGGLPSADVGVSITNNPATINTDLTLRYTVLVTNFGPNVANSVVLTSTIPAGVTYVSSIVSQGASYFTNIVTGTTTNGYIIANLGDIQSNSIARMFVTLQPTVPATLTTLVGVTTASSDTNSANDQASFVTVVKAPGPIITANGAKLTAESGPVNGAIDNNETVTVEFRLANTGTRAASNLVATLQSGNGVVAGSSQTYGAIAINDSVSRAFTFKAQGLTGATLTATLALTDGDQTLDPVSFTFQFPSSGFFTNSNTIVIPDSGPALLYPSTIQVAGLAGAVSKVSVTLYGITHSFPRDINILLVSPDNTRSVVFSHVGGATAVTNVTLTVSEQAATTLSPTNAIVAGTYLPTRYGSAVAYPNLGSTSATSFDVFNETTPNGTWALYVVDDSPGDSGVILSGWSIALETVQTVNPAADVALSLQAPSHASTLSYVTNTVTVQNNGPYDATHVVVANSLPAGASLLSVVSLQGTANTNTAGVVSFDFGTIPSGNGGSFTVVFLSPAQVGQGSITATVTSDAFDSDLSNNQAIQNILFTTPQDSKLVATYNSSSMVLLTVIGEPNHSYVIQSSTNLVDWSVLSTNTLSNLGQGGIWVNPSATEPYKFYRTLRLP